MRWLVTSHCIHGEEAESNVAGCSAHSYLVWGCRQWDGPAYVQEGASSLLSENAHIPLRYEEIKSPTVYPCHHTAFCYHVFPSTSDCIPQTVSQSEAPPPFLPGILVIAMKKATNVSRIRLPSSRTFYPHTFWVRSLAGDPEPGFLVQRDRCSVPSASKDTI